MADLATLQIAVDSRPVTKAAGDLDTLSASAGRTGTSVDKLTAANARMAAAFATSNKPLIDATRYLTSMQVELERVGKSALQIKVLEAKMAAAAAPTKELAQEIRNTAAELIKAERNATKSGAGFTQMAGRTKLASHEVTNLAFQFQDLGVQLAGGANPLVAIAQQGSQVSGIMMQSGMSVGVFTKAVGSMLVTAAGAVLLNPIFLGIAAAVGAVSLGMNFLADDIKKTTGVTVTAGDIMTGTFNVIKKAIKNEVVTAFENMGLNAGEVWDKVVEYTRKAVNIMIGLVTLTPRTMITAFQVLPAAIADLFYSSTNLAIRAINSLTERAVGIINSFVGKVQPILSKVGITIPTITAPQIATIANSYAGAASKAMTAFVKVATDTIEKDYIGVINSVVGEAAADASIARNAKKGGDKVGKTTAKAIKDTLGKELADMELAVLNGLTDTMRELQKTISAIDANEFAEFKKQLISGEDAEAVERYEEALRRLRDITEGISLADAFGGAGEALEGALGYMVKLGDATMAYTAAVNNAGNDKAKLAKADREFDQAKLVNVSQLLGSTKKLFKEQSAGYKMVEAAEKAAAALAMINTVKQVAAGASKIFSQLGVFAFPVVGAMLAAMASLGFSGGSSAQVAPPSASDIQAGIGTGTVLGDSSAQSESLANSLKILSDNSNSDLEYSNEMVRQLRSIAFSIEKLTSQLARQFGLAGGGMFSTTQLNLGQSGSAGFLGMFSSSTTRTLFDQGIEILGGDLSRIIDEGISARVYSVTQVIKKKSGFFGIGGGTKTTYETTFGQVDAAIQDQFTLIISDLQNSVLTLLQSVGQNLTADNFSDIVLPNIKLSFKDMSGEEIETALQAYFSSVADQLVRSVEAFNIEQFQKAGEGLFETLTRISKSMTTVDVALRSLGFDSITGGLEARVTMSESLIGIFGSVDDFQSAIASFSDKFLTEAERMQPIIESVRAEMDRLGFAGITTKDQFKELVRGLDLNTVAGQDTFASLMAVAPAFAKATDYLNDLNNVMGDTASNAASAAKEIASLQRQLLQEQGNTEAIRAQDLAALQSDEARALQEQIWAEQDARAAREAAAREEEAAAAARERALAEAARKREEAAQRAAQLAEQRSNLQIELLRVTGKETEALALQRKMELAAMDASLRGLQQQIWAAEDAKAASEALAVAEQERASKISEAESELRAAYQREADIIKQAADNFRQLGSALRSFVSDIALRITGMSDPRSNLQRQFTETARLARLGNVEALQALPQVGKELADFVVANATDRISMIRELAQINMEAEAAAEVADRQASIADQQLDALTKQVEQLISLEEKVVSVAEAIDRLTALTAVATGVAAPVASTASPTLVYDSNQVPSASSTQETKQELNDLGELLRIALFQIAKNTGKTSEQLMRWDGDGMPEIRNYA